MARYFWVIGEEAESACIFLSRERELEILIFSFWESSYTNCWQSTYKYIDTFELSTCHSMENNFKILVEIKLNFIKLY